MLNLINISFSLSRSRTRSRDRRRRTSRSPSPYYKRLNPSPCRVLGVFGLSLQTDERDVRRVFEKYGRLDKVKLVTDPRVSWTSLQMSFNNIFVTLDK